jgi:hypothetical protein
MSRTSYASAVLAIACAFGLASPAFAQAPRLSAAEIVTKNIAARGGLTAWRNVQTMSWSGTLEAGGNNQPQLKIPGMPPPAPRAAGPAPQAQLPFRLELARDRKSRLEIDFAGQTAVQVYDGAHGWKLRPYLNRLDVEPFTADELKASETQADLDGALIDYAAKGTKVDLEGVEKVEGKDCYKLKLTLKNNRVLHEWIDAATFLETKVEGSPRKLDGKIHAVSVFMREYRTVDGLSMPHVLETVVDGVSRTEKIRIEKVSVNPRLDATRFVEPKA